MKEILPKIIYFNQSAFVSSGLILDYILVTFETFYYMKNKRVSCRGHMASKLDITKSYDRVEWIYLQRIMEKN